MRPGELAVHDLHGAAVGGDELEHHRQPDASALDGGALGGAAGVEGVEHVVALLERDTRAAVLDGERGAAAGRILAAPGGR